MAGTRRTSVLIADDHPLFREAIARVIAEQPELELVAEAGTAAPPWTGSASLSRMSP